MPVPRFLRLLFVWLSIPTVAVAQQPPAVDHAAEYKACLSLIEEDAHQAFEGALDWRSRGGGVPAAHCAALAVLALGYADDAAVRLETIGADDRLEPPLRAEALAQAADAWRQAGRPADGLVAIDRALSVTPQVPAFLVDRGVIHLDLGRVWEAIDDFDRALLIDPRQTEALQFRATAYRFVEAYDLAETDIVRLLNLAPGDPAALLELGEVRLAQGDIAAAQEAFLLTLENAAADGPLAAAAREKIEAIALGTL